MLVNSYFNGFEVVNQICITVFTGNLYIYYSFPVIENAIGNANPNYDVLGNREYPIYCNTLLSNKCG